MKLLKVLTVIMILAFIIIGLDYFTLSDNWRFYRWDIFRWDVVIKQKIEKNAKTVSPAHLKSSDKPASSGEGILPDFPYVFTQGWHLLHVSDWENHLKDLKGKPDIHALEIGSYEGFSAIWQVENILTDPTSTITCIDIFDNTVIENRFDRNIEATGVSYKIKKIKGSSEKMLRGLSLEKYDYVYIDGCHLAKWVLSDAVLCWDLVKPGGLIIFDDYRFLENQPEWYKPTRIKFFDEYLWKRKAKNTSPEQAIDAFINIYKPYLEVVFQKYQVVVRKKHKN